MQTEPELFRKPLFAHVVLAIVDLREGCDQWFFIFSEISRKFYDMCTFVIFHLVGSCGLFERTHSENKTRKPFVAPRTSAIDSENQSVTRTSQSPRGSAAPTGDGTTVRTWPENTALRTAAQGMRTMHFHWRIQGDARDACPPRSNFFHFHAIIIGWHTPLWEILDPPLPRYISFLIHHNFLHAAFQFLP